MKTNNLTYKTSKTTKQETIYVSIRLNDECRNGHQDFAITADIYQAGKPKSDKYFISGGCCHEEIIKAFPEFKIFVDLHLCDYLGIPMFASANGYYHLKNGFNNTPVTSENFKNSFCEYYRISENEFNILNKSHSETHYAINLIELGIPAKWKAQADEAIKILEELTGDTFIVDSTKNNLGMPTEEKIKEELTKQEQGYYSPEQEAERIEQAKQDFIRSLDLEANKKIEQINKELSIKKLLFDIGGRSLLDNVIYYNHNNQIGFNWRSYGARIEKEEAEIIYNKVNDKIQLSGFTLK